ncbi:MAG: ATP-binding cassette domain-containing protein, partial [Candidatus Competibacteraceae bacterium]|nr:ATP-binding cassette domain-containing protein [Candidatus Competibacteraceae bacterium]
MNELAVSARGLTKRFGGFTAVDQVDLAVKTGTIHALIGPNGAGKTTVFNLLTRFLEPDQGSISFFGKSATRLRAEQIANRGVVRS